MNFKVKVREAVKVGGKIANVAVHLTASTTAIGRAGALLGVFDALVGDHVSLESEYAEHLRPELPAALRKCSFDALLINGALSEGRCRGKEQEYYLPLERGRLVWVNEKGTTSPFGPWLEEVSEAEAAQGLGRALWECLGPNVTLRVGRWGETALLERDNLTNCLPSKTSADIEQRVAKYQKAGINRGVLLHGPPGTGKSYIMRDVARRLGGFSLRHTCEWGSEAVLQAAVEVLRPRAVLIDDIDRGGTTRMLDTVEAIKQVCPLTIVSANYTDKLDPAIRRPGRFDESILVEVLDAGTFARMVGDETPASDAEQLKSLPVAYIAEYLKVQKVLGQQVATARLAELLVLHKEINDAKLEVEAKSDAPVAVSS